ncbi:hypothetical protein CLPU_14c00150 [Gottschalkia purinilytica]|uniref:Uncharacterized protein n=1 Tax=Gottschalkia purinilytica TaxID=1503 RepID=A0A0L0W830_GOTPU|nr:DUF6054 family protein [Gottschalkia purinilytica]KNF07597.1 hypothetical protein CLPU_14c00150 [Gottschalkia purinilytica]
MSKKILKLSIEPSKVIEVLKGHNFSDLVHEEFHQLENEKYIGTLIYEKFFYKVERKVSVIIIVDNLKDFTEIRIISTGTSQGLIFDFDWGASGNVIEYVSGVLKEYIIE